MALKFKLSKTAYGKLSDEMKEAYIDDPDKEGSYILEIIGLPEPEDAGELKRALERVRDDLKEAEAERDGLQTKLDAAEKGQTAGDKDVARLTKRHEQKIADLKTEHATILDAMKGNISKTMIDGEAGKLAAKISTVPVLMAKTIAERMVVEFSDDMVPTLKITKDGKASDLKIADLEKEIVDNKDLAGVIIGSKARGSSAASTTVPSPGSAGQGDAKPVDFMRLDPASLTEAIRARVDAQSAAKTT